jgi:hypothetical protein
MAISVHDKAIAGTAQVSRHVFSECCHHKLCCGWAPGGRWGPSRSSGLSAPVLRVLGFVVTGSG